MPPRLFTRAFTLVWIASLLYSLSFQLPGAALPLYAETLGATDAQLGLMIGVFALAAMLGRTIVGWQLDRGPKKYVLGAGALIFALSAIGYALCTAVLPLLGLRAFNGVGHAAGQAANQALATDTAPTARRAEALAMQALTLTLALAVMPTVGVVLANALGFGVMFALAAVLALAAGLVALFIPEEPRPAATHARFFNTGVTRPGLVMVALMVAFGAVISLAPTHAARSALANPGLFFLAYAVGQGLAQVIGGRLSDRRGRAAAILPGLGLAALGLWAVALAHAWWLLPAAALFGGGMGLAQSNIIALAADYVPPTQRGSAIATVGMYLEGGISAGATAAGLIGQVAGLSVAFLVLGTLPALALLVLVATPWGRRTLRPTPIEPVGAVLSGRRPMS